MILFGTRGVKSTIKLGSFNCPQCEESRSYRHQKVTNFLTLFFIPLIPLGSAGEYVECSDCKSTFVPQVLINNPDKDGVLAIYEKAIRHSMILIMLAGGAIKEKKKEKVLQIINKFGSHDLSMSGLESNIHLVKEKSEDITTYLKKVGPLLNEHGKGIIIKCALAVASLEGKIEDTELHLISKMERSMKMSSSQVKGIINERLVSKI